MIDDPAAAVGIQINCREFSTMELGRQARSFSRAPVYGRTTQPTRSPALRPVTPSADGLSITAGDFGPAGEKRERRP